MPKEAFVFGGQHGIDHVPRDIFESQFAAETLLHPRFAQWDSISIN